MNISVTLTCSSDDNLPIWAACLIFLGVIIGTKILLLELVTVVILMKNPGVSKYLGLNMGPWQDCAANCTVAACTPESQLNEKKASQVWALQGGWVKESGPLTGYIVNQMV